MPALFWLASALLWLIAGLAPDPCAGEAAPAAGRMAELGTPAPPSPATPEGP